MVRVTLQRGREFRIRLLPALLVSQDGAEEVAATRVVRIERDGVSGKLHRERSVDLLRLAEVNPREPSIVGEQAMRFSVGWIELGCPGEQQVGFARGLG
jgi:hypothetical protein